MQYNCKPNEDYYFKLLVDNGSDYRDNNLSINLIKKNDSDEEKTNLILDNDGNIICKNMPDEPHFTRNV